MNVAPFRVVALDRALVRTAFKSGVPPLDQYFHHQVSQDIKRRVTACFVAITQDSRIAGYYTLSSASVLLDELPAALAKKLPRYPSVPAIRMGRLAMDINFKGCGLGGAMLADALARAVRSEIAAYAMLVDARDDTAADFYRHHGFKSLPAQALTLYLPLASVPER